MKSVKLTIATLLTLCAPGALAAQAAPAQAPTAAEACARLQEMLVENQAARPALNELRFAVNDRALKDAWSAHCSGRSTNGLFSYGNGSPLWRDGRWLMPDGSEHTESLLQDAAANAPILGPFLSAHRRCAPGCGYVSWGIWGDKSHQQRRSCHNSGQAIDIHAITCGGTHKALSARFDQYVSCMRGSLGVIYRSKNHFSHAHFQLHGCSMCQGQGCGGKAPRQRQEQDQEDPGHEDDGHEQDEEE